MTDSIFLPADFFLMRSPTLAVNDYKSLVLSENWITKLCHQFETDELFREAVYIASPALIDFIRKNPQAHLLKASSSLLNYFIRMTSRSTPFGLFSFVAMGMFADHTKLSINLNKLRKKARPDMAWLYTWIMKEYEKENNSPTLLIHSNPLIKKLTNRFFIDYLKYSEVLNKKDKISIQSTQLVNFIFQFAKKPIKINDLLYKLNENLFDLNLEKTKKIIFQLISGQFLLPTLFPTLLQKNPFQSMLEIYKDNKLNEINEKINDYNQSFPEKGESKLTELNHQMNKIISTKHALQVDTIYDKKDLFLSKKTIHEIKKALQLLWKISYLKNQPLPFTKCHNEFLEKYGLNRTVNLLEFFTNNQEQNIFDDEKRWGSSEGFLEWESLLMSIWENSIFEKQKEIVITDTDIDSLFLKTNKSFPSPYEAQPSLDAFCQVFSKSQKDLDDGNFYLTLFKIGLNGCSSIGRFLHLLDEDDQKQIKNFYQKEENLDKEVLFTELSYLPAEVRSANLAIHPCFRKNKIDLEQANDQNSIALEEIYLGATLDRFYFTLKDGRKEIVPIASNVLNPTYAPSVIRFMREVTFSRNQHILPFSWGKLSKQAIFLPRVRYKKTILAPATWQIKSEFFKGSLESILKNFKLFAKKWDMPQKIYLTNKDQYLLIDLTSSKQLLEIAKKIKNNEALTFTEYFSDLWVKSERGVHLAEFVIPFLKNPVYAKKNPSFMPKAFSAFPFKKRWKLPGSEWLYVKFYLQKDEKTNFFILHKLYPFVDQLKKKGLIKGSFFIRYFDLHHHLRFRMRLSCKSFFFEVLTMLQKIIFSWMQENAIDDFAINSYERELERYGNEALIEDCEAFFCKDSLVALRLLSVISQKEIDCDDIIFYTLCVINFINDLKLNQTDIDNILSSNETEKSHLEGFRKYKDKLFILATALCNQTSDQGLSSFHEVSFLRQLTLKKLVKKANNLSKQEHLNIFNNLLHMHCNRIGCDSIIEKKARLFAMKTFQFLLRTNKKKDGNFNSIFSTKSS